MPQFRRNTMDFGRAAGLLARLVACLTVCGTLLRAEDTVEIAGSSGKGGVTILRGQVLEYDGRRILVRGGEGRDVEYPSPRVLRIVSTYHPKQDEGDRLFAARRYEPALAAYDAALQGGETRPWARRQLLARQVWCLRHLGQFSAAGRTFLALVEQDPESPYFDCIPLVWMPGVVPGMNPQEAGQWVANNPSPVAQLLGASLLLAGNRAEARPKLFELAKARHPFVPWLAEMQMWRADYVTLESPLIAGWERQLERLPPPFRAGPSQILGLAWEHHRRHDLAAAAFLKAPLLDPRDRNLAAFGLFKAGDQLLKDNRPDDARRVWEEIVRDYPDVPEAHREATGRLAQAGNANPAEPAR